MNNPLKRFYDPSAKFEITMRMYLRYLKGETYSSIARDYNLTPPRIRQKILKVKRKLEYAEDCVFDPDKYYFEFNIRNKCLLKQHQMELYLYNVLLSMYSQLSRLNIHYIKKEN